MYGEELKIGKRIVGYGLNESDFENRTKSIKTLKDNEKNGNGSKTIPDERIELSRGKFSRRSEELLLSALIIKVRATNKRGNCYSITPLGICYLWDSDHFDIYNITKITTYKIFKILKLFATKHVTSFESEILSSIKIGFDDIDKIFFPSIKKIKIKNKKTGKIQEREIISNPGNKIFPVMLGYEESIPFGISFYLTNYNLIKYPIAQFRYYKLSRDESGAIAPPQITVNESGKHESFDINEAQFHHYIAKIIIYLIIFHYGLHVYNLQSNVKKKIDDNLIHPKILKEHLEIILSFQSHLQNLLKTENQHMEDFSNYLKLKLQVSS